MPKKGDTAGWSLVIFCFGLAAIFAIFVNVVPWSLDAKFPYISLTIALVGLGSATYGFMEVRQKIDKIAMVVKDMNKKLDKIIEKKKLKQR
jgi:hypothetical protein